MYRNAAASSDKQREFGRSSASARRCYEHHTTSLVFNDPPLHTRVRRLMMGALNQRAIARMEAGVVALVDGLLDRLGGASARADLIDDFAAQIPVEVIGNLLDVPHDERGAAARLVAGDPVGARAGAERRGAGARQRRGARLSRTTCATLVAERRAHPGDPEADVLTRLIQGEYDGERLTETELLHNCIFLLNAGHETTTNLIGNGMHALLAQRGQLERLQREPALLNTAVEELLRFESPLQLNNRQLTAPIALGARELPAGTFVTLGVGAANRDPAQFADPDTLDIARKPNLHVAFGHGGARVCRHERGAARGAHRHRRAGGALSAPRRRRRRRSATARVRFRGFVHLPVRL